MKTVMLAMVVAVILLSGGQPCDLDAQSPERRVHGAEVELRDDAGLRLGRGELLAFARDTVWLLPSPDAAPVGHPAEALGEVRVRAFDSARTLTWSLVGWGITSLGLTVACTKYGESSCGAVPVAVAVPWSLIGGLAAIFRESRRWRVMGPEELNGLPPYARFPQGRPGSE